MGVGVGAVPGVADLPLHGGHVPRWMLVRMERMAEAIADAVIEIHGVEGLVRGLADPIWFQAFNNIIGMDWDSSGSTTVLTGILKSVSWRRSDWPLLVLGGKGERMLRVPEEAAEAERRLGVEKSRVESFSRAAARLDSSLLQDGYSLYHHAVIAWSSGLLVIQQGMNPEAGMARRYHIDKISVVDPHSGVAGVPGEALNALDRESSEARKAYLDLIHEGSRRLIRMIGEANRLLEGRPSLLDYANPSAAGGRTRRLAGAKPYYRPVRIDPRLEAALRKLEDDPPVREEELPFKEGVTPRVVRALALVADLILSVPTSTRDPVTAPLNPFAYAYAVGGKDGVPYRYDRRVVERVTLTLEEAVEAAKLGNKEKLRALLRLRRLLERSGIRGLPR